jgi:hypothetical protein
VRSIVMIRSGVMRDCDVEQREQQLESLPPSSTIKFSNSLMWLMGR